MLGCCTLKEVGPSETRANSRDEPQKLYPKTMVMVNPLSSNPFNAYSVSFNLIV